MSDECPEHIPVDVNEVPMIFEYYFIVLPFIKLQFCASTEFPSCFRIIYKHGVDLDR